MIEEGFGANIEAGIDDFELIEKAEALGVEDGSTSDFKACVMKGFNGLCWSKTWACGGGMNGLPPGLNEELFCIIFNINHNI